MAPVVAGSVRHAPCSLQVSPCLQRALLLLWQQKLHQQTHTRQLAAAAAILAAAVTAAMAVAAVRMHAGGNAKQNGVRKQLQPGKQDRMQPSNSSSSSSRL